MNLGFLQAKNAIRSEMLAKRDVLPPQQKALFDQQICHRLWQLIDHMNVQVLHSYLPMRSEVDIFPFIRRALLDGIKVIVPKTLSQGRLVHLELNSLDQLKPGRFGTQFPFPEFEYEGDYDLIIVPGLAFNPKGQRLGYGGGYYDRFLKTQPSALKVGVFYAFQYCEKIPVQEHDIALDQVIVPEDTD